MYVGTSKFSNLLFTLVEEVYYKEYETDKQREVGVEKAYAECKDMISRMRDLSKPMDFEEMYEYAKFIMDMEHVYFYHNTDKAPICCDKYTETKCTLFFPKEEANMYIKIELEYGMYSTKTLGIRVYREFGKKLADTFTVNNGVADYKSSDDVMLANTINAYVQSAMAMIFETYVELAYHKAIYDTILTEEDFAVKFEV